MNLTSVPVAELREFAELVDRLRGMQRRYFAARAQSLPQANLLLDACKDLERRVDRTLDRFRRGQPALFDAQSPAEEEAREP